MASALAGVAVAASAASAQTVGLGLAQTSNCMSCHRVDRKVVGPGFTAIAERFAGNAEAVDYLAQRIINGSSGHWGPVPMPRQVHVSEKDAKTLAQWILSLKEPEVRLE
ncbi:c-type cytochrome [Pusillimonas sp.]|uniref:c-type cytochrome n=1 Tax=Pusillimonas sp. TaxID=3040095 RepID=UPI002D7EA863|nr:c-type cytochrome [Pusillimonas sp.]